MSERLPVWFVRRSFGFGIVPVSREGWAMTLAFLLSIALYAALCIWMMGSGIGSPGLWLGAFVIGTIAEAVGFLLLARPRTDMSVTSDEYRRRQAQEMR